MGMVRSVVLGLVIAVLAGTPDLVDSQASAAGTKATPGGPDLKETLEKGLKARRPNEFQFIAHVVTHVEEGRIPLSLVNSTFLWSRRQQAHFPFPYFERGLRERAKRAGISFE
jgi:hypothetical protein